MVARINSVVGRPDNVVAVDLEAGLGDHYVVYAVIVEIFAPILIGAALYRVLRLILDILFNNNKGIDRLNGQPLTKGEMLSFLSIEVLNELPHIVYTLGR